MLSFLTPVYLGGRFWTERELGALLHKDTLIPVLHGVTFEQVKEYSGILPDLAGFETARDSVTVIAHKLLRLYSGPTKPLCRHGDYARRCVDAPLHGRGRSGRRNRCPCSRQPPHVACVWSAETRIVS